MRKIERQRNEREGSMKKKERIEKMMMGKVDDFLLHISILVTNQIFKKLLLHFD